MIFHKQEAEKKQELSGLLGKRENSAGYLALICVRGKCGASPHQRKGRKKVGALSRERRKEKKVRFEGQRKGETAIIRS